MKTRKVTLYLAANVADEAERVFKQPLPDAVAAIVGLWHKDERRTPVTLKNLRIGWPVDWYQAMLRTWGQNAIANNVRRLLYADLLRDLPDAPDYCELRDHAPVQIKRKVSPSGNRNDHLAYLNVPEEWYKHWQAEWGRRVTTYVKAVTYLELESWNTWPRGQGPSMPQRLATMLSDMGRA